MPSQQAAIPAITEPAREVGKIVRFKDSIEQVVQNTRGLSQRFTLPVHHVFTSTIKGFATKSISDHMAQHMINLFPNIIESIEPDLEVTMFNQTIPWGITRVGATDPASSAVTSASVDAHVFVFDTGVQSSHPDLNVVQALSFVRGEKPDDANGHGTAVAGVIGARRNTSHVLGVAPGVRIYSYKVLDRSGNGSFSNIIAGLDRMVAWKSQNPSVANRVVANLSLGAYTGTIAYNVLDAAVVRATDAGITCVVAAGNSGGDSALFSPAHVAQAMTVGAYDVANVMPSWSNYGSLVDLLAPGVNVLTTYPRNKTAAVSGTSFAAPHVAGAAALYLARYPTAAPADTNTAIVTLAQDTYSGANPAVSVGFPSTTTASLFVKDL